MYVLVSLIEYIDLERNNTMSNRFPTVGLVDNKISRGKHIYHLPSNNFLHVETPARAEHGSLPAL